MVGDARISTALPAHPKTKKLIRKFGPAGGWSLVCLILWAASSRSSGELTGMSDEDIELAADWGGEEGALVQEMVRVRFLDGTTGDYVIHDWAEHNPWAAGAPRRSKVAKANAEKKWGAAASNELPEGTNAQKRSARLSHARQKGTHTSAEWMAMKEVCSNACVECGAMDQDLSKDHILSVVKGGSDAIENIQPMCRSCNASKSANGEDKRPVNWFELLVKRLQNVCETPAPSPSPSPTPTPTSSSPYGDGDKSADADFVENCPQEKIIDLYHRILPMGRQVREWTPARSKALRARWREKSKRQNLDWWERFFVYAAASDFLTGKVTAPGRRPFGLSLDWLVKAENLAKVVEGAYENEREAA